MEETVQQDAAWKSWVGWGAAIIMAFLWFTAGLWKLSDISGWQLKLTQLLVPVKWSLAGTMGVAMTEVAAGVLLLRPAWRRWGGYLSALLLLVFMAYVGINYQTLQGEDCSCFPWLERAVGPAFFWSDAGMLAIALLATYFAPKPAAMKGAVMALAGVVALSGVMLAIDRLGPAPGGDVPATITADGESYGLLEGKTFLYFFNPSCMHCLDAGQTMAKYEWKSDFVGIPTQDFDWGPGFVEDAGLKNVKLSPDLAMLKETFPFEDVPYGAVIEDGRILERIMFWEEPELSDKLRGHGFID
jgi:uncharacterized membrane protein YphA (DoxX/SURF4 family)